MSRSTKSSAGVANKRTSGCQEVSRIFCCLPLVGRRAAYSVSVLEEPHVGVADHTGLQHLLLKVIGSCELTRALQAVPIEEDRHFAGIVHGQHYSISHFAGCLARTKMPVKCLFPSAVICDLMAND